MNDNERKFDDKIPLRVTGQLSDDLKAVFKPQLPVPPEVDRAVMDRVHRHFVHRQPRRLLRWAASVAAAAAVIVFVFMLEPAKEPIPTASRSSLAVAWADIDRNGRVDVLDAFKLARRIESADRPEMKWDINGDGLVNRGDVDSVALAAVRLDKGVL